jgi:hypothetical protein
LFSFRVQVPSLLCQLETEALKVARQTQRTSFEPAEREFLTVGPDCGQQRRAAGRRRLGRTQVRSLGAAHWRGVSFAQSFAVSSGPILESASVSPVAGFSPGVPLKFGGEKRSVPTLRADGPGRCGLARRCCVYSHGHGFTEQMNTLSNHIVFKEK